MKRALLQVILAGLPLVLQRASRRPVFREFLKRHDTIAQIQLQDGSLGRHFIIAGGKIRSAAGLHPQAEVSLVFKDVRAALMMLRPNPDMGEIVHAAKSFTIQVKGPDPLCVWFMQLLNLSQTSGLQMGTKLPDGYLRYTMLSNGGPMFVHVKDGRIVRLTPIVFDSNDAASWTIEARGRQFTPARRATIAPHALAMKSVVYSSKRLLQPMKRVDFDPNGERNPQNRGKSGYVPISWDEALDIVAGEIKRQRRVYGPGAMIILHGSHHQWGNVNYYLSAMLRFGNLVGFTRMAANPDSWEGWYWGAMHHWGHSQRVGMAGAYGTMGDCLRESDMVVFWSSDPESTNGGYKAFEGTQRRQWLKQLGVEFVHIDPFFNPTAQLLGGRWIPIRPTTDAALAHAIMYVWVTEDLYDKEYVERCTTGFAEWRDYLLGVTDGVARTPEWQESETGVPAQAVRALARQWAAKKTYLAIGSQGTGLGGACRGATGAQFARSMVMLLAMRGVGKPGINLGNMEGGCPVDHQFYFPGYSDGGISGDLNFTGNSVANYQRMPHLVTINPVRQQIPRQQFPEAVIKGEAVGYPWDGMSPEVQFVPFRYPTPGYSRVHMIYKYGGSFFSTLTESNRMADAYRHDSIEFVVNQSVWMEGESQFADVILPACTQFERHDIGEWSGAGGLMQHGFNGLNHRMIVMQHKCIEPLGESKSDYEIFSLLLQRLGLGAMFTEGCSELDWCKRVFNSSDLPKHISWAEFCRKGYFVVPAEQPGLDPPVNFRWFAEGRMKDIPETQPLPSQWAAEFGLGLQTPSGKIEFIPERLQRSDPDNDERPVLNRYIPAWEGPRTTELASRFPLQMLATHSRYSFHTGVDGKNSFINDIAEHRHCVDGHYYWLLRMNTADAGARGIAHHSLVKVFNDRGAVICAADVSDAVTRSVVKSFEASAEYQPVFLNGEWVDIGGSLNALTSSRSQQKRTSSMSPNSCLVEVVPWPTARSAAGTG